MPPTQLTFQIKPAGGGDFATLQAAYNARKGDLVSRNTIEIFDCYGGGNLGDLWMGIAPPTGTLAVDSQTDETHYFHIRAAAGQAHPGKFDTSKAWIQGGTDNPIWCAIPWTRFGPGLSVDALVDSPQVVGSPHSVLITNLPPGTTAIVDGIVARSTNGMGLRAEYCHPAWPVIFRNCMILRGDNPITGIRATNATVLAQNCTIFASDTVYEADNDNGAFGNPANPGKILTQNCYGAAGTTDRVSGEGSSIVHGANDIDGFQIPYFSAGFVSVVSGQEDFRLTSSSPLRGKGADLTTDGVITDFIGGPRAAPFDVGAHQITAIGSRPFFYIPAGSKIVTVPTSGKAVAIPPGGSAWSMG